MTARSLVSTVIPVYNRPRLLREAVASVLGQTYRPIEIIVVDDGSTDDTGAVVDELGRSHEEVVAIHTANRGAGAARERGRLQARGEFIQYLDSDDLLRPRKFEVLVDALRSDPDAGVAYGVTRLIDESGAVLESPYRRSGEGLTRLFPTLLVERWWNTHTPLYRREVSDLVGPWTDMRMGEDWEYDARVGALGTRLVHRREPLSDHRKHAGSRLTGGDLSGATLRDLARLLPRLHACAVQAGVPDDGAEMRTFSRWAFLTARRCGTAGLVDEARTLLRLAANTGGDGRSRSWDLAAFRLLGRLVGLRWAGRAGALYDRIRS